MPRVAAELRRIEAELIRERASEVGRDTERAEAALLLEVLVAFEPYTGGHND